MIIIGSVVRMEGPSLARASGDHSNQDRVRNDVRRYFKRKLRYQIILSAVVFSFLVSIGPFDN